MDHFSNIQNNHDSFLPAMIKADLGGEGFVAKYGEEEYVKLVAAYSLWVGLASIVLAIVGFGKLASLVPKNVRTGFKVRNIQCKLFLIVR